MPAITDLSGMWRAFSEIDAGSMREDAQITPRLAVIGPRDRTSLLEAALQRGPRATNQLMTAVPHFQFPLSAKDLDTLAGYDLRIALLDSTADLTSDDVRALGAQPGPLVLVIEQAGKSSIVSGPQESAGAASVTMVAAWLEDAKSVQKTLLPAIADAMSDSAVALGRAYPGLRPAVVQDLIQRTCMTNSIYAAGTGVAEMVPGLGIPFAVADVIILTKNQLVMAYKIGLIMGETGEFRDVLPKLAGVVGAGFMWRQVARELVAFLPLGVVLKVAIAYAGTYATGQAIYHWYATGEKLDRQQLRQIFNEALVRGKEEAVALVERMRRHDEAALDEPAKASRRRIALPRRRARAV
ncbi:MAG: hypothetical protein KDI07_00205 [Anaerolineae bacterium]|nr:hypothetical protein [Anaerolineae bacterium]MCB0246970.1 hypothetical protein [Anaerolineae bacterium]MCB9130481.1 hypothetical protein [Anaerolineales bacterium]HRX04278.1 hypothetical protein [Anaerolineae bacterium]